LDKNALLNQILNLEPQAVIQMGPVMALEVAKHQMVVHGLLSAQIKDVTLPQRVVVAVTKRILFFTP
jgi:hypothetical protein